MKVSKILQVNSLLTIFIVMGFVFAQTAFASHFPWHDPYTTPGGSSPVGGSGGTDPYSGSGSGSGSGYGSGSGSGGYGSGTGTGSGYGSGTGTGTGTGSGSSGTPSSLIDYSYAGVNQYGWPGYNCSFRVPTCLGGQCKQVLQVVYCAAAPTGATNCCNLNTPGNGCIGGCSLGGGGSSGGPSGGGGTTGGIKCQPPQGSGINKLAGPISFSQNDLLNLAKDFRFWATQKKLPVSNNSVDVWAKDFNTPTSFNDFANILEKASRAPGLPVSGIKSFYMKGPNTGAIYPFSKIDDGTGGPNKSTVCEGGGY